MQWLDERRLPASADGAVALPEQAVLDVLAQAGGGLGRMAEEVQRWRSAVCDLANLVAGAPSGFESERVDVALARDGGRVRVADAIPLRMLVLDGSVVVTPGAETEPPCDVVIRSGVVGRCLLAAFEHLWVGAEKYATFVGIGGDRAEELTAVHVRRADRCADRLLLGQPRVLGVVRDVPGAARVLERPGLGRGLLYRRRLRRRQRQLHPHPP